MIVSRRRLLRDTALLCATALLNACTSHAATPTATVPSIQTLSATPSTGTASNGTAPVSVYIGRYLAEEDIEKPGG